MKIVAHIKVKIVIFIWSIMPLQ